MRTGFALVILAVILCSLCGGCGGSGHRFDISVQNLTRESITLALTKDGPPFEPNWAAPEQVKGGEPGTRDHAGFAYVPAGRTAKVSVRGKLEGDTRAILRVYRGDLSVGSMIEISPSSPDRVDLPLTPGLNRFVIDDAEGRLVNSPDTIVVH